MDKKNIAYTLILWGILLGFSSSALNAQRLNQSTRVEYNVQLVPQQTGMSCWAASAAMIVGWVEQMSIDPGEIARGAGYWAEYETGLPWFNNDNLFTNWGITRLPPMSPTPEGLYQYIRDGGPIMVGIVNSAGGGHVIVVRGIVTDGTAENTSLLINDPWERGMSTFRSNNQGSRYTLTYEQFMEQFLGRARRMYEAADNAGNPGLADRAWFWAQP